MALPNKYLNDKKWLYQKYIVDQLSTVDIGKEIGANPSSVLRRLRKFNIKVRSCSFAAKKRKGKRKFKAEKLNDRDWLYQKYITEQLTSYQVAELSNSNQKSVFTALKRHSILIRTVSEASKNRDHKSKYEELENRNWLYQKYIEETQSSRLIAKLIGCDSGNVIRALRKYDIKIRDNREAHLYIPSKSFYYELLNNKEWLEQKYIEEGKSTIDIAELCGAKTSNSARQSLIRHNINVRNISEGLTCNREEDGFILNIPVIDGSLLGDAYLGIYNKKSCISNPRFCKKNIGKDHIEYVYKQIFDKNRIKIKKEILKKYDKRFKKEFYISYSIESLSHKELKPIYRKWYPEWNNYKKSIPEDVDISPVSLLNWFMDDGNSYQRRKDSNTKQIIITFCSECFTKNNQQMIVDKINRKYGKICGVISCNYRYKGEYRKKHRIGVYQSQAPLFYDIIGPYPVASMEYKWK